jgi:hypothetical protein
MPWSDGSTDADHFEIDRGGYHLHWDAAPAWVCTQYGEPLSERREVDVIQEVIRALDRESEKLLAAGQLREEVRARLTAVKATSLDEFSHASRHSRTFPVQRTYAAEQVTHLLRDRSGLESDLTGDQDWKRI